MTRARLRLSIYNYFNYTWEHVRATLLEDLRTFERDINTRVDRATLLPSATVADLDGTSSAGTSAKYARGDHKHDDTNRATDDEKAALVGTNGTPSAANKFVTGSDPRVSGSGLTLLTADPGSPANDTWWAVRTGSSPTTVSIKARIGGVTQTVASMEF